MKTGALIRFACEAGALIAASPPEDRRRLRTFGEKIGLAFQLADDILDLTSDAVTMGKATGKDAARGKGTLVALHGIEWAETALRRHVHDAEALLAPYGARASTLIAAAHFIADRKS
jgi:farnesyl diphosphate synthase